MSSWTRIASRDRLSRSKARSRRPSAKAVGDRKLEADGKADKIKGKIQNAVGGLKDALRGK
jgi:hypothetical protein